MFRAMAEGGSNPRVWEKVESRAIGTSYTHARIPEVIVDRRKGVQIDASQKEGLFCQLQRGRREVARRRVPD